MWIGHYIWVLLAGCPRRRAVSLDMSFVPGLPYMADTVTTTPDKPVFESTRLSNAQQPTLPRFWQTSAENQEELMEIGRVRFWGENMEGSTSCLSGCENSGLCLLLNAGGLPKTPEPIWPVVPEKRNNSRTPILIWLCPSYLDRKQSMDSQRMEFFWMICPDKHWCREVASPN